MEEIWKDVVGYEGLYQVSNLGNVKSIGNSKRRSNINIIKNNKNYKGYLYNGLTKDFKRKFFKTHRLVAQAFIPNPDNKPQVNHINGIKDDNRVKNLEWCTISENVCHSFKLGLNKGSNYGKKLNLSCNSIKVNQYDKKLNLIKQWDCIKEASLNLLISDGNISKVCKGKRKSAGGFVWKYN